METLITGLGITIVIAMCTSVVLQVRKVTELEPEPEAPWPDHMDCTKWQGPTLSFTQINVPFKVKNNRGQWVKGEPGDYLMAGNNCVIVSKVFMHRYIYGGDK